MEILDLRHLRSRDIEPLLEEEKSLWQRDLQWDYSSSAALIKRYVDASALPGYAAIEDGKTVGYSFYVYENYKGLIGDVFVSDTSGALATEAQLLTHVFETLQATPGIRRIEAQLMNLRHKSSDLITEQKLQSYRRKFMVLPLDAAQLQEGPSRADLQIELWDSRWSGEAAPLITRAYEGHVDSDISDQYRSRAGAARFLDNIVHYPGCGEFDARCSFLAFRNAELCGMILTSVVGPRVSHITQVCVEPQLEGLGIARALIGRVIQKLRQRDFEAVTLTVTSANLRAVRLYEKLGFSTLKEFSALAWDAPESEEESDITDGG